MSEVGRRQFIIGAAGVASSVSVGSRGDASTGGVANVPFQTFSEAQAETYAAWCDVLVIGAAAAGVAHFADKSISGRFDQSLLLSRFFVSPPLSDFYIAGIAGIDQESEARFGATFRSLERGQRRQIVDAAVRSRTQVWFKPDPNLFYLVSRSDAVDVVYGTERGFRDLDVPYLALIAPPTPW